MKRLQQKLLPICIMLVCGSASVSTSLAADRHIAKVQAETASAISTKQLVRAKGKTQSRVRQQSASATQIRTNAVVNAAKIANTASSTVRSRTIETSNGERTPVYDLPEVSHNNPRDPNGPVDGTDYRPPIIEEQPAPLPDGLNTDLISRLKGDPRSPSGRPQGMSEEDYVHKNFESDWNARRVDRLDQMTIIKFAGEDGSYPGGETVGPAPGPPEESEEDSDDVTEEDTGLEDEEEADMVFTEEEVFEDPEPEGDDPDEMRGRMASEQRVITGGARTGQGPINPVQTSAGQGKRKPGEWLPGETIREHGQRVTSGTPLPEDGGPDESSNAGSSQALNKERFNRGMVAKPTPDAGQGGGPINPGPNAVQGQVNLSNFGLAASPDPEAGEGGGTVPPRPEM